MVDEFSAKPLTPANALDWDVVMGPQGGCYGCWCTYFRLAAAVRDAMSRDERRAYMQARIDAGPPPGVIGYWSGAPIGWVQVGPRADTPRWNGPRTVSRPLDLDDAQAANAWAVSCFFLVRSHRGTGLSHRLLAAAIDFARKQGADTLEACPVDHAKHAASVGLFVGPSRIFHAAGFASTALRKAGRPLMRLVL